MSVKLFVRHYEWSVTKQDKMLIVREIPENNSILPGPYSGTNGRVATQVEHHRKWTNNK